MYQILKILNIRVHRDMLFYTEDYKFIERQILVFFIIISISSLKYDIVAHHGSEIDRRERFELGKQHVERKTREVLFRE